MKVSSARNIDSSKPIQYAMANRDPLLANPLAKLPLGSIRPQGWIKHQIDLMVDGMVGHLQEISDFLKDDNGWFGTENDGWEEQAYWFRGFYNLGIISGDQRIQAESARWIEAIIATQDEDGYFGPPAMKRVKGNNGQVICDIWPHMVMLDALRSYYEVTQDNRIIDLMTAFFRYCKELPEDLFIAPLAHEEFGTWRPCIQILRAGEMIPHIYWLFNITGDKWLLDVATRFHQRVPPPESEWLCHHVVNFTQRFRESGNYYVQTKDPNDLKETEYWYAMHMGTWGQMPGGGFAADENIREGKTDPKQGWETCAMAEFNRSFYMLGQITGQSLYADRVEDIIFNSFPASQTPDLKALHYLTAANQPQLDSSENHDYQNKCRQINYSAIDYRCCQHNVAMGWPYYTEHLWLATAGNGIAAWLYGASEVTAKVGNGQTITIKEETDYPFDTSVKMTISADGAVEFPLYLRVPSWCSAFSVRVNGEKLNVVAPAGDYVVIERSWANDDVVDIEMPVKLSLKVWEKSCGSVTLNRGPLSYSLRISEEWRKMNTHLENWPEWEVFSTTPWNYGLVFNSSDLESSFKVEEAGKVADQPWTVENAPIRIIAKGKRIPNWKMIDETITDLQPSPIKSDEPVEEITLIPMGCARLRLSCFPVISEGKDAREWVEVSSHDEAMELRGKYSVDIDKNATIYAEELR